MAKAQVQPTNKELRAQAADLKASFNIGKQALTGKIIDSINEYLKVHELVKIKSTLASDKEALSFLAEEVAKGTKAQLIEKRGFTFTLYRKNDGAEEHKA